jgi:hypothetical protein
MKLEVDGRVFHVAFRHVRLLGHPLNGGHRPELLMHGVIKAITSCAIVASRVGATSNAESVAFTAIGNAVCYAGDNFDRRAGRYRAFMAALRQNGALRECREGLMVEYLQLDPRPCHTPRPALTEAVVKARWEAGWEKRKQREAARGASS